MHTKLLQSCPTLWNPMDYSQPGSSVHGILWARTLEWVASALLQRTFPTQGSNLCLLHVLSCRWPITIVSGTQTMMVVSVAEGLHSLFPTEEESQPRALLLMSLLFPLPFNSHRGWHGFPLRFSVIHGILTVQWNWGTWVLVPTSLCDIGKITYSLSFIFTTYQIRVVD